MDSHQSVTQATELVDEFRLFLSPCALSDEALAGALEKALQDVAPAAMSALVRDFPDVRQGQDYSCGAAALQAVCQYFEVGPEDENDFIQALGTNAESGTRVSALVRYARALGLRVLARDGMSLDSLAGWVFQGIPVICPVQAYGTARERQGGDSGHYVVVLAVDKERVTIHDPVYGLLNPDRDAFLTHWWDRDDDGKFYERYGMAIWLPEPELAKCWACSTVLEADSNTVWCPNQGCVRNGVNKDVQPEMDYPFPLLGIAGTGEDPPAGKRTAQDKPTERTRTLLIKASSRVLTVDDLERLVQGQGKLAKLLGAEVMLAGEEVDLVIREGERIRHGIIYKLVVDEDYQIGFMRQHAFERRLKWEREQDAVIHTIMELSDAKYVYRRGFGGYRADQMLAVSNANELKQLLDVADVELPELARRVDPVGGGIE